MRVLLLSELTYPQELSEMFPQHETKKKKRIAAILLRADDTQAMRCMLFSFGLLFVYLLTERLSILIPALLLAYYALLCKRVQHAETLF